MTYCGVREKTWSPRWSLNRSRNRRGKDPLAIYCCGGLNRHWNTLRVSPLTTEQRTGNTEKGPMNQILGTVTISSITNR